MGDIKYLDEVGESKENIIIYLSVFAEKSEINDVLQIGNKLVGKGFDNLTDGGFWIWDINNNIEFYSPNFRKSLGFKGEKDFPSIPTSWQSYIDGNCLTIAISNFNRAVKSKGKEPYYQEVKYTTKKGEELNVLCSGMVINENNSPKFLVGTHKII